MCLHNCALRIILMKTKEQYIYIYINIKGSHTNLKLY